jgi:integrase/recombinase XerC
MRMSRQPGSSSRAGVTPKQLLGATPAAPVVPTIAAYIEQVGAAVPAGTRAVYDSYWRRVIAEWGDGPGCPPL